MGISPSPPPPPKVNHKPQALNPKLNPNEVNQVNSKGAVQGGPERHFHVVPVGAAGLDHRRLFCFGLWVYRVYGLGSRV